MAIISLFLVGTVFFLDVHIFVYFDEEGLAGAGPRQNPPSEAAGVLRGVVWREVDNIFT